MIILIHTYATNVRYSQNFMISMPETGGFPLLTRIVSGVIAVHAVPMFFLISSYLYFFTGGGRARGYRSRIFSRIGRLLIPYFFWNSAVLVSWYCLQSFPSLTVYFSGHSLPIREYDAIHYFSALTGILGPPICRPLWFLRDLIVFITLSPLFNWMVRKIPWGALAAVLIYWLFPFPSVVSKSGICFFYIGALWNHREWTMSWIDRHARWFVMGYPVLIMIDMLCVKTYAAYPINSLVTADGMICLWWAAGCIACRPQLRQKLFALAPFSFFIYAAHGPVIEGVKKILFRTFPPYSLPHQMIVYFIPALVALTASMLAMALLQRAAPRFLALITGGRVAEQSAPPVVT